MLWVHKQTLWRVHSCFMLMCDSCAMPTCQRIWDIWSWQNIFHTHTVISVTRWLFWLQSWASAVMPCRDTGGCILGSYVTWAGPWWTWFYYTDPVSQTASQSASFRERLGESEDARWEKEPDWTAVRQVFPPVNHSPQNRSNDAGSLRRPAGWNWVKEDLMSHLLHWSRRLSIIISDMMT